VQIDTWIEDPYQPCIPGAPEDIFSVLIKALKIQMAVRVSKRYHDTYFS